MALELFKPFVMKRLVETQKAANIKEAKKKVGTKTLMANFCKMEKI